jgi:hypothetical protein
LKTNQEITNSGASTGFKNNLAKNNSPKNNFVTVGSDANKLLQKVGPPLNNTMQKKNIISMNSSMKST